jgi:hypothetical protein
MARADDERERLLTAVAELLDAHGGSVALHYVTQLCLARAVAR